MTAEEYFNDWCKVVDIHEAGRIIKRLSTQKQKVCPDLKHIFHAFRLCKLHDLRVVCIGLDPYNSIRNGIPVATGIAFANRVDTPEEFYSSSLEILKESVIDFTIPHRRINFDSSLEKWEKQGVLMLNTALSVPVNGKPGSHMLIWRPFMTTFLKNLSSYTTGIVYLLMGNDAQSLEPYINPRFNYVIRCRHPAYYARTKTRMPSDIWKEINDILIGQNGYGIEWYEEF